MDEYEASILKGCSVNSRQQFSSRHRCPSKVYSQTASSKLLHLDKCFTVVSNCETPNRRFLITTAAMASLLHIHINRKKKNKMKHRTPYIVGVYSVFRVLEVKINYFSLTLSRLVLPRQE